MLRKWKWIWILCLLLLCGGLFAAQAETVSYPGGLTAVQTAISYRGDTWILKDKNGGTILDNLRSEPRFYGEYALVRQGTGVYAEALSSDQEEICRWGMINEKGKICIPLEYDWLELINDSGIVKARLGEKYGLLDSKGRALLDLKYDEISGPINGYFSICIRGENGKDAWGVVDEKGKFLLPVEYKSIDIDPDGTMIVRHAEKIGEFEMDALCGYMNMQGEWIIPPRFLSANSFDGDYAQVEISASVFDPHSVTGTARRWGIINRRGEFVLPAQYNYIGVIAEDGTVSAEKDGEEYLFRLTESGAEEIKEVPSDLVLEDYMPFTGSKVARLEGEPTLEKRTSSKHDHPRLDGATALFPVYSAIVEAVYPEETRYSDVDYDEIAGEDTLITCTKTNRAYDRLIEGKTDIIFCAGPSDAQIAVAKAAGVEFELTAFGKESFVFIVNKDNPLSNITVEQIQDIYSGKITRWEELGVENMGEIIAYQRPENSGSQTALERLMGDIPIMEAPGEYISDGMGDILSTIEYRNLPNAIGYTFRFFCTEMIGSDVKLLSIDGIEPNTQTIADGTYPITSTLYMVTRKGEDNPNVRALMDWVLSEQGRELIEKSGYVFYKED